jgi:hypothetical protein
MTAKPVALPPQLHACVNDFLSQANEMQKTQKFDAISASILYAAARYNVHGFVNQGDGAWFKRSEFVDYMTDLYRRMLEEQIDVLGASRDPEAT